MALTPESTRALTEAIDAIVKACGDDPTYKDLIGKLKDVETDVGGAAESDPKEAERDSDKDDYSFDTAQSRHTERLAASRAADAGTGTDGGEGK